MNTKTIINTALVLIVLIGTYEVIVKIKSPAGALAAESGQKPAAVPVSVAPAIGREVVEWDDFSGRLEAVDRVEIRARVAGTIDSINFEEGQSVTKGQLLFNIDPKPYEVEVSRAEAALVAAKSQAAYADSGYHRASRLIKDKAIAQKEFDESKNAQLLASSNIKVAEAALDQAKLNLDYTKIIAPVAGRVSRAEITTGNLVNAGGQSPILTTIVSTDPIYASFDADEQTFVRYLSANGNNPDNLKQIPVLMGLSGEKELTYKGVIKSFDNELNTRAGTVRVRAVFDNKEGKLVPGLFAHISIGGSGKQDAILITERAISTDQNKKFVYVVGDDNKVIYREIKMGPVVDGLRVVREGLKADEKIVVNGLQRVHPGTEVAPQMVSMEDPAPDAKAPANATEVSKK